MVATLLISRKKEYILHSFSLSTSYLMTNGKFKGPELVSLYKSENNELHSSEIFYLAVTYYILFSFIQSLACFTTASGHLVFSILCLCKKIRKLKIVVSIAPRKIK